MDSIAGPYPPANRGTLVFWGLFATFPFGGLTWQVLHYLIGARKLGFDVWYVEDKDGEVYDTETLMFTNEFRRSLEHVETWMEAAGLGDRWIYRPPHVRDVCLGARDARGLAELYREADAVIDLCAAHHVEDEHLSTRCRVYMETDPVAPQVVIAGGDQGFVEQLERYDHHFTYGRNLGAEDCLVPIGGEFDWVATWPPVVMDLWTTEEPPAPGAALTTVTTWKFDDSVTWGGETWLWSKHRQFRRLIDLPAKSVLPLGMAVGGASAEEEEELRRHGWQLVLAPEIYDPEAYRAYVRGSLGELTVSKEQVVVSKSGWFSDRSVCYLAAGRPVITQDTGFSKYVPTGRGLFTFDSQDEALAAIEEVASDYERHSSAAREIAREHFADDRILGDVFRRIGLL